MLDDFRDDEELDKGGEFLDEFRQRLNSQPLESLEERKNDINRSRHIFLGTVLGVGLAGIVSWFILSPDYSKVEDTEIPVIRRPQTAVKVQPADPGGMEILNQDKTVYDIVEKKDTPEVKVENLLPPPEEPKVPTITADALPTEKLPTSPVIENAEKIITAEEQKKSVAKQQTEPETKKEAKIDVKEISAPKSTTSSAEVQKNSSISKAETPASQTAPRPKEATVAKGTWQIQLISSPNKSAMSKAWNELSKKYAVLKDLPHEIQEADLGNKGIFYRLMAGSFQERGEADKVCNAVKSAGGSSLVKKK